jgi:hypothetical protein
MKANATDVLGSQGEGSLKVITALVGATLALVQPAFSEEKDAAYSCIEEMSAGLTFNETTKKWDAIVVRSEHKFIIGMKFIRSYGSLQMSDYDVTITKAGTDDVASCTNRYEVGAPVQVENDEFGCRTKFFDFIVNVKTLRFLRIYSEGYGGGKDIGTNTPSVSGGACTEID